MTTRSRNWCFTLNNYTQEEYDRLCGLEGHKQIRYLIIGKEVGEQGTPHLQGFIIFFNQKLFNQVKDFFKSDRYHIEKCIGSATTNIAYCSKDNDYIEFGDPPKQGARKDIQEVKEMVKEGKSLSEIWEVAGSYQSYRMAEIGKGLQPMKARTKPLVKWYYGETGTGKSYTAFNEFDPADTWASSDTLEWFNQYDGQKYVIVDDFRACCCKFSFLLRLLDAYPLRVKVKGGFTNWTPEVIVITSCHHPKDVYKNEDIQENIQQLIRRIDIIQEFKKLN